MDTDMMSGFHDGSEAGQQAGSVALNIPKRSGHEFYLGQIMGTIRVFTNIIANMQNISDARIIPAARQCIITISDDKIRYMMLGTFRAALVDIEKDKTLSIEKKSSQIIEVCQIVIGEVYSYADEFLGISKVNVVAPLATFPMGVPQSGGDNGNQPVMEIKAEAEDNVVLEAGMFPYPLGAHHAPASEEIDPTAGPTEG